MGVSWLSRLPNPLPKRRTHHIRVSLNALILCWWRCGTRCAFKQHIMKASLISTLVALSCFSCISEPNEELDTTDEQTAAVSSPRGTGKIYITGRIVAQGKYHTVLEYCGTADTCEWLSGGSINGKLAGMRSNSGDTPSKTAKLGEVNPPTGVTAATYFQQLKRVDAAYCDCAPYQAVPTSGYNSNSWVNTLIRATNGRPTINMSNHVGGDRVIPSSYFQ